MEREKKTSCVVAKFYLIAYIDLTMFFFKFIISSRGSFGMGIWTTDVKTLDDHSEKVRTLRVIYY